MENLKPGDRGSKVVQLRNVGNVAGQIAIWVSNIEELDYVGDGAHLDDYLYFEVNCAGAVHRRPHALPDYAPSLRRRLAAATSGCLMSETGQTVQISWFWEFLENYQSQTEAQGDSLSFDIHYLLGEVPPPNLNMSWLEVQVLDQVTMALLDAEGRSVDQVVATDTTSPSLTIPEGAAAWRKTAAPSGGSSSPGGGARPVGAGQALVSPVFSVSSFVSASRGG